MEEWIDDQVMVVWVYVGDCCLCLCGMQVLVVCGYYVFWVFCCVGGEYQVYYGVGCDLCFVFVYCGKWYCCVVCEKCVLGFVVCF